MFGIAKSVITRSNLPASNMANASFPLLAVSTTCPSKSSIILTASQTNGSSSTTRIRRWGKAGALIGIRFKVHPTPCLPEGQLFFAIRLDFLDGLVKNGVNPPRNEAIFGYLATGIETAEFL